MPEPAEIPALTGVSAATIGLDEAWAGALVAGAVRAVDAAGDVRLMSADGLVRVTEALGELFRRVQALQAPVAAELAARSRPGTDEVARKHGFSSAEHLIASATGGRYREAVKLVAVGAATAPRAAFTGEVLPPKHPHLARAVAAGAVCVDAADVIRRFLDGVAPRADRVELGEAEAFLVERAPVVGVDGLHRLVKLLQARLDPDGVKPREDELRGAREFRIWEDEHGMIRFKGAADPVSGAPIKLAIETLVGAELHRARDAKHPRTEADRDSRSDGDDDDVLGEQRTIAQMNLDALADLARHSLGAVDAPAPLRQAMVVARIDGEALETGRGYGTIDGIEQPVSVSSIQELAMSAGISPLYVGEGRENLQLGRSRRLFSQAQKLVLTERDGGCAWPGCTRPPSHTQAHHIRWWSRHQGRTDFDNGIMLCAHHHHRVHDDGWAILIDQGYTWFVPPAHLDPSRRPRAGNRRLPSIAPPPPDATAFLALAAA
ncbi:HNH endonuclease signature motif containing protein [Agromyces italicus]|uniref:HNH endonuclease signature motif containing protein n=1 Tax=Agromyces italicus TaxID=279572 RepID=UPI0003B3C95F|nr:HNH endonuclease signature motif containing protein [Agromyces italicus]